MCWCVDVLVLMCWCVDVLMCWCVAVLMCWYCVDVLMNVLMCWYCVDVLINVLMYGWLMCWWHCVDVLSMLIWCVWPAMWSQVVQRIRRKGLNWDTMSFWKPTLIFFKVTTWARFGKFTYIARIRALLVIITLWAWFRLQKHNSTKDNQQILFMNKNHSVDIKQKSHTHTHTHTDTPTGSTHAFKNLNRLK